VKYIQLATLVEDVMRRALPLKIRTIMRLLLICSVLLLSSCATKSLTELVQAHPDYDISQMKTFTWADPPVMVVGLLSGSGESSLTRRAKAVGEAILTNKGYVDAGPHKPEMIAAVMIGAITQTSISQHKVDARQGYYDRTVSWTQENEYLRGGVAIILTNPDNGVIMWQGSAIDTLKANRKSSGQKIDKFGKMVEEMLPASR
jgi:hypothetical protein